MTLLAQIREDMMTARRGDNDVAKALLVTLYSEAARVGKDAGNRDSTDDEVAATVRKFVKNAEQTATELENRGRDASGARREIEILSGYLPKQMTAEQLEAAVRTLAADLTERSPNMMGKLMGDLKAAHGGTYDGKMASEIVKRVLAE